MPKRSPLTDEIIEWPGQPVTSPPGLAPRPQRQGSTTPTSRRGFAGWPRAKHHAASVAGGQSVQAQGLGHRYTVEEAREWGKLGGAARAEQRKQRGY